MKMWRRPSTPRLIGAVSPKVRLAVEPPGTLECCCEHESQILEHVRLLRAASRPREEVPMEVLVDRCAGLDVHQKTVMACVRTSARNGGRAQQVREFRTFTDDLRRLRDWLVGEGVTQVAMEATGVYWRPVWHVLEDEPSFELLLVNAQHVKAVPGRKTDVADASWLAQLLECGLLRGSFVPPPVIARLRDLTRYRKKLVEDRAKETQRIQKLLEDAGIKLDSVVSDVLGKSAREMLEALIAGQRDPDALADMARTRMRPKIPELRRALAGRFGEHHALLLHVHLDHIDHLSSAVDRLDAEVEKVIAPFDEQVRRLCTIPGVGTRTAEVLIAEIGVDMSRFPTAHHLAPGPGCARATTSRPGSVARAGPARATRPYGAGCARRRGRRYGPRTRTCPPSSGDSSGASARRARAKPSSPWPTPCS